MNHHQHKSDRVADKQTDRELARFHRNRVHVSVFPACLSNSICAARQPSRSKRNVFMLILGSIEDAHYQISPSRYVINRLAQANHSQHKDLSYTIVKALKYVSEQFRNPRGWNRQNRKDHRHLSELFTGSKTIGAMVR